MVYFPYSNQPFEKLKLCEMYPSECWIFEHWVGKVGEKLKINVSEMFSLLHALLQSQVSLIF